METLKCQPSNEKIRTFADKFSKFKSRFMLVLWAILGVTFVHYTFDFLYSLYSITKAQESTYLVEVKNDKSYYTRVGERPATWVPLNKISKRVQQAIISSEDGQFFNHPGYDLKQLRDAINDSFVLKKKMRGASTITQQLVKNLYLNHDRSFGRKAQELVMALMIEKYANKQKILEMYLNVIEYGKGLYGIDAAAKYYFKKSPAKLNAREAAFLAMLLPSPKRYSKSFKNRSLTHFANHMIASILLKMQNSGYIGEGERLSQLGTHFSWEKVPKMSELSVSSKTFDPLLEYKSEFGEDSSLND
jgi:monofunctional biosynthetic peptidoglycan transglycosylase